MEFVLVSLDEEADIWLCSDENIMVRGFITLKSDFTEDAVRKALCEAIQLKFSAVNSCDLEFPKANRRKLTKPVNCNEYFSRTKKSVYKAQKWI